MRNKKIRKLLKRYTEIIEELQGARIIRSSKVVSDYGEYISSKKLNLKLMPNSVNKGYDAVDKNGKRYEIKSRKSTTKSRATVIPAPNKDQLRTADFLVAIIFNDDWSIRDFVKIPMSKVKEMINKHRRITANKKLIEEFSV